MVSSNKSDITKASKTRISRNLRQPPVEYVRVFPKPNNIYAAKGTELYTGHKA